MGRRGDTAEAVGGKLLSGCIFLMATGGGFSDARAQSSTVTLDTIEVQQETAYGPAQGYVATRSATGTKTDTPIIETPQSISVITRDRLDDQGASSLAEALRYTPGVQGETFGFNPRATSLRLRGFLGLANALYLDGLPLRTLTTTGEAYDPEPYGMERIEVLRGPASVLYGQGSPGGLINMVTKRPTQQTFREVTLEGGNFNRKEARFDMSGAAPENASLLFRLTGLLRDSDSQVDFARNDRKYIAPALTWQPSANTRLTLLTHYQQESTGDFQWVPASGSLTPTPNGKIPRSRNFGEPNFDHHDRSQYGVGYAFEHRTDNDWTFRQNLRYGHSVLDRAIAYGASLQADRRTLNRYAFTNDKDQHAFVVDNQAQWKFSNGGVSHTLLMGLDYQKINENNVSAFGNAPSLDIFNPIYGAPFAAPAVYQDQNNGLQQTGLYLQDQIKINKNWVLSLGGRHDWAGTEILNHRNGTSTRQNDSAFTGRAGLVYLSDVGLAPYVSYSQSFLPVVGTSATGSPFQPETGEQYEVGVKYQPIGSKSFVTLAAFDLTRQNIVDTVPTSSGFQQRQTGEVRSRGIEVEGVASFDSGLDLIASYTYLDAEITKSERPGEQGRRPEQTPNHMASVWANYTLRGGALSGLGIGGGVRYVGSTWGNIANTVKVPDYTVVDAALYYQRENVRFTLNVHNLFDKAYVASAFNGGTFTSWGAARTVKAGVTFRW
jgi:iron complex outermembrane receptor protein